jgi:transcriptional regulator with XRE-family HTH domain
MKLNEYIKQNKLTQNKFAIKSGLTRSAICRLLKGQRFPTPETMNKIELATLGQVKANDFLKQAQEIMAMERNLSWKEMYNGR